MIKWTIKGVPEVKALIQSLPSGVKVVFMRAFTKYLIGDSRHGLSHEPGYHYVSPFQSYSDDPAKAARQRAWQFANLDKIGHDNRTHDIANGWVQNETSDWARVKIENDAEGVGRVMGDQQTRHSKAAGWKYYFDVIMENLDGAIDAGLREVNKLISQIRKS